MGSIVFGVSNSLSEEKINLQLSWLDSFRNFGNKPVGEDSSFYKIQSFHKIWMKNPLLDLHKALENKSQKHQETDICTTLFST